MFDLLDRPLHWIPVKWPSLKPSGDGEGLSVSGENEVELKIEIVSREEAMRLFPAAFDMPVDEAPDPDRELNTFKRLVVDWRKISSGGKRVEMSDEHIRALLSVPMFGPAFAQSYILALGGVSEIREGNSDASPRGGRAADGAEAKPNS